MFEKVIRNIGLWALFWCISALFSVAQDIKESYSVEIGNKNIALEEPFSISAIIKTQEDPAASIPECKFPELKGFVKQGYTKSIARSFVGGHKLITYTISQNYKALREGTIKVKAFKVFINKTEQASEGCVVAVGKPQVELPLLGAALPSESPTVEPPKVKPVRGVPDAFLALNTSKNTLFVGEGFTVTLALYVSDNNTVPMEFDHNEIQIPAIAKKLKQASCWEENYGIEETLTKQVVIHGKKYTQYKFYQTSLYPLNNKVIRFPSVSLRVLRKEVDEKGATHFSPINFEAQGWELKPLDLPKLSAVKGDVPVGVFSLKEQLDKKQVNTGNAIQCKIIITGDGNMSSIKLPELSKNPDFDLFPPKINMVTDHGEEKNVHIKTFTFQLIPKRAGNFALSNYFKWIYFNPQKQTYDTLRSQLSFKAKGETISANLEAEGERSIYDGLDTMDSAEESSGIGKLLKNEANILIVIMLIGMVYIFMPNRNK